VLKNLAEDVDRTYWYSRHYVTLSQDTHPTVTAIEHHVLEEPGDRVIGCFGQRYDDYRDTVTLGIMVLFEAIRTLMDRQLTSDQAEKIDSAAVPLLHRLSELVRAE
jgi:hypothetical protein